LESARWNRVKEKDHPSPDRSGFMANNDWWYPERTYAYRPQWQDSGYGWYGWRRRHHRHHHRRWDCDDDNYNYWN
jgi:hypothetical protein